jgi:ribose transport system permease protein
MVSPLRPQEMPALPHFSESFSWRMITTLVWLLLLGCAAGALWWYGRSVSEHFLDDRSLKALWREAFPLVLLAGPMAVIMIRGGLDLSVGAVAVLASVVTVSALADGKSPQEAFTLAMLFSGGIGLVHALLIGPFAINPIILTLVTALIIQTSAVLHAAEQAVLLGQDAGFLESLHYSPIVLGVSLAVSLLWIQLAQIGGGSRGAPLAHQRWLHRTFLIAPPYVISSLAAGIVGCSLAARFPLAVPNTDNNMAFLVILAAVIGGNCSGRRFGTVIGAVAGAGILAAFKHLMTMEAVSVNASILILASTAGGALLLSQLIYWIVNLIYRNSREGIAATV